MRFADMGEGWEKVARAHYPFMFGRVMSVETIKNTYGMNVNSDGSIPRVAGDAIWMGHRKIAEAGVPA